MNRYEYKGYWIEILIEGECTEHFEDLYLCPYIEFPHQKAVEMTGDRYVTYEEAKIGAERYVDIVEAFAESEVNWYEELPIF